ARAADAPRRGVRRADRRRERGDRGVPPTVRPRAARGGGSARLQHRPEPRTCGRRRHPGASALARRPALGRRYQLHAGGGGDARPAGARCGELPEAATLLRMNGMIALADGGSIHFEDVGEGPAVVLLHPGLWDMRTWEPQIQTLVDAGFRVLRFDQRGYGTSSMPEAQYSSVDDTIAVLDERRRRVTDGHRAPRACVGVGPCGVGLPGLPVGRGARGPAVRADRGGNG